MGQRLTLLKLLTHPGHAGGRDLVERYERLFSEVVVGDAAIPALAFWRGRIALWSILRALDIGPDTQVILPAYTCAVVPAAVKFAGGKCIYVDAAPDGFNCAADHVLAAVTRATRVIIAQHTYGVPFPVRDLCSRVAGTKITVIEDCCQLVCREGGGGPVGAAAFHSMQWSKPYSTGLGGMAVFRDRQLYQAVRRLRETFPQAEDRRRSRSLALQVLLHAMTVRPRTQSMAAAGYRWAQQKGLVRGTTAPAEAAATMPADYAASATNVQAVLGMRALDSWTANVQQRARLTREYLDSSRGLARQVAAGLIRSSSRVPALWAVPVLVEDKARILEQAARQGLPIATWFRKTPAHLDPVSAGRYDYVPGSCPRAEALVAREVHLLTSLPAAARRRAGRAQALVEAHLREGGVDC